jgi:hypothetical protein
VQFRRADGFPDNLCGVPATFLDGIEPPSHMRKCNPGYVHARAAIRSRIGLAARALRLVPTILILIVITTAALSSTVALY